MATALGGTRVRRRGCVPSVREVCLLGSSRPATGWTAGDRVQWSGRVYRITAAQGEETGGLARHYAHLSSEVDGEG